MATLEMNTVPPTSGIDAFDTAVAAPDGEEMPETPEELQARLIDQHESNLDFLAEQEAETRREIEAEEELAGQ